MLGACGVYRQGAQSAPAPGRMFASPCPTPRRRARDVRDGVADELVEKHAGPITVAGDPVGVRERSLEGGSVLLAAAPGSRGDFEMTLSVYSVDAVAAERRDLEDVAEEAKVSQAERREVSELQRIPARRHASHATVAKIGANNAPRGPVVRPLGQAKSELSTRAKVSLAGPRFTIALSRQLVTMYPAPSGDATTPTGPRTSGVRTASTPPVRPGRTIRLS